MKRIIIFLLILGATILLAPQKTEALSILDERPQVNDPILSLLREKPLNLVQLKPIEYKIPERPVVPGNTYYWGQCVWYVKNKRPDVPNSWSNAINWRDRAKKDGWIVTDNPIPKAIAWSDTYYLGHVAYVESINPDNTVTVSEMNYKGVGVLSYRTAPKSDFTYIY